MKFIVSRDGSHPPVVIDRLGRNLLNVGFDIASIAFEQSAVGDVVTVTLGGAGPCPETGLPIPFRMNMGTHIRDTRLYDHHNVELVNALRAASLQLVTCQDTGTPCYRFIIPLRPDDQIIIRPPSAQDTSYLLH